MFVCLSVCLSDVLARCFSRAREQYLSELDLHPEPIHDHCGGGLPQSLTDCLVLVMFCVAKHSFQWLKMTRICTISSHCIINSTLYVSKYCLFGFTEQHWRVKCIYITWIMLIDHLPAITIHETSTQRRTNFRPPSTTLAQHQIDMSCLMDIILYHKLLMIFSDISFGLKPVSTRSCTRVNSLPLKAPEYFLYKAWKPKGFLFWILNKCLS